MIEIKEITTKEGMRDYVKFPFTLYKNSKYWVPPIIKDEIANLNKDTNPAFKHAQAQFFLAYKNDVIVGRMTAIINWNEVKEQKVKKMRFGWFDVIDDIDVTKILLNKAIEIGKENGLEYIEGPVGFSNLDKVGVLTKGFDFIGTMVTWYNHPYYKDHFEQMGFVKEKEYLEHIVDFKNIHSDSFSKISRIVGQRYGLKKKEFKKISEVMPYVDKMFDLMNLSYSNLSSFVYISKEQRTYFKDKYINLIDPEFISFIVDEQNELVAFAITLPSFSKALQKSKGKLFPYGFIHLLKAKWKNDTAILYLIGVHPKYQNKGVVAMIMDQFYNVYDKKGVKKLIRTPELEENTAINKLWLKFEPLNHKRRRTYRLEIKK